MNTIHVSSLPYVHEFNHINSHLVDWNLSPVEGEALHLGSMGSKYGHVKIKMYASTNDDSKIIWNVPELELPSEFKPFVNEVLSFFLGYLEGLRGHRLSLTFEVNDGSCHPVDSAPYGFTRATIQAIIDCFDHSYNHFKANRVFRRTSWHNRNK